MTEERITLNDPNPNSHPNPNTNANTNLYPNPNPNSNPNPNPNSNLLLSPSIQCLPTISLLDWVVVHVLFSRLQKETSESFHPICPFSTIFNW